MYAVVVLVDRAGRAEARVALDVVDRSGSGVQTEVLDFVECVIVLLERLKPPVMVAVPAELISEYLGGKTAAEISEVVSAAVRTYFSGIRDSEIDG